MWRIRWAPNNASKWQMGFNLALKGLMPPIRQWGQTKHHSANYRTAAIDTDVLPLTLYLLTWRIWWAPNNASKWQMGFNSAFKGLIRIFILHTEYLLGSTVTVATRSAWKPPAMTSLTNHTLPQPWQPRGDTVTLSLTQKALNKAVDLTSLLVAHNIPPRGATAQRGPWPPHSWGFLITHDASQSVGLVWTSD